MANTDAFVILLMFQDQDDTTNIFEEMTPEEAEAISRFYGSFATELSTIAPPPFAAEWHALQIEIYQALSEFSANIASQGMMFASIQAATLLGDLSDRSTAAEAAASAACADFATWASGDES
ncbi:MAG: hypothetical protein M9947_12870 [Thermomicrobiales bacterium]|nr:hypothetical protein [Thermomicrobiales bacterium]